MVPKPEIQFIRACSTGKSDVVRDLLEAGLSPDKLDNYGLTGLIWAARKGQISVAEVLLAAGANLETKDRRGRTALHHAVAFKRYEFVEFLALHGALLNPVDLHGWTPLDLAQVSDERMVKILGGFGADRRASQAPLEKKPGLNRFGTGGATGGPDIPIEVERIQVQLNALLSHWTGEYSPGIEAFYFPMYVDGSLVRYTKTMNLLGPEKAKRTGRSLSVKIGVSERWWRSGEAEYKTFLTNSIENGLHSMIALLQRNKHEIRADALLSDWTAIKTRFLETPAPPFAAEKQRASMMALLNEVTSRIEARRGASE